MTPAEHYRSAEQLLDRLTDDYLPNSKSRDRAVLETYDRVVRTAQAHATLSLYRGGTQPTGVTKHPDGTESRILGEWTP